MNGDRIERARVTTPDPLDLLIDLVATSAQLINANLRVLSGAVDDLTQQRDEGVQAGLRSNERAFSELFDPAEGLLKRCGCFLVDLVRP